MSAEKLLTLDFSKEEALAEVLPKLPVITSKEAEWNGIYLAYDYYLPGETPEILVQQHGIIIFTEVPTPIAAERKLDDRFQREQVVQGDVVVIPANIGHRVQWDTAGGIIMLGFEPAVFTHAMYETIAPDRVAIAPHFAKPDPLICQLGLTLKAELESGGLNSRLYAEAIANLLAIHLLQHYSTQKPTIKHYTGGLSKNKLQQAIDYINANLDRPLGLTELAQVVQMSPGYFSRLFKQSTGLAPHQYLIQCRVKLAKQLLCQGVAIAEVAYKAGFANQGHLNYHFKRCFGITPKAMLMQK
ncbi:MAG TPA: AraC family transcriptional regulator [Cyanobacteria bacterium UBA11049]|nr:AraC family transcriptional regulator [Cyanobacteria bacterium UBA11049]